jgi:hypothetical protein
MTEVVAGEGGGGGEEGILDVGEVKEKEVERRRKRNEEIVIRK